MSTAKLISGGQLYVFPASPNKVCYGVYPRFPGAANASVLRKPRISSGRALRARAMAAVCAPPPQTTPESFYQLLGIPETGSISEIKKAYKQLARKYHPDVSPSDCTEEYTKMFIMVQQAYETLSDPQTRALYDMDLTRGLQLNFSSRRSRRYERMEEMEEWQQRWHTQLDDLKQRSMHKNSNGSARGRSSPRTRRKRNSVFDLGF